MHDPQSPSRVEKRSSLHSCNFSNKARSTRKDLFLPLLKRVSQSLRNNFAPPPSPPSWAYLAGSTFLLPPSDVRPRELSSFVQQNGGRSFGSAVSETGTRCDSLEQLTEERERERTTTEGGKKEAAAVTVRERRKSEGGRLRKQISCGVGTVRSRSRSRRRRRHHRCCCCCCCCRSHRADPAGCCSAEDDRGGEVVRNFFFCSSLPPLWMTREEFRGESADVWDQSCDLLWLGLCACARGGGGGKTTLLLLLLQKKGKKLR